MVAEARGQFASGATLLAVRHAGRMLAPPPVELTLGPDHIIVVAGTDRFSAQGRTSFGNTGRGRQTLLFTFEAEDERYRWLNDVLCLYEGIIEMPLGRGRVYACVNEL